jgi:hypothetical protein
MLERLSSGRDLPIMDQKAHTATIARETGSDLTRTARSSRIRSAARNRGNTQYPSIDTLCRNDMCAPRTLELNVTTAAPTNTASSSTRNWLAST